MDKLIYVDHSATTPVRKEVLEKMLPYFSRQYANPSSNYMFARKSREKIDEARNEVAKAIKVKNEETIYFTSGGSEADNMIIKGIARANRKKGNHIITSKIEHPAVLNTCNALEKEGFKVSYIDVDKNGRVRLDKLEESINDSTILVSIMLVNNEIGTIQDVKRIGILCREKGVIFHSDAVQAIGNVKIDVNEMCIDALSLSAHKFYGPKGVGAAYIRKNIDFCGMIDGGHQEFLKRAGTENVAGIIGLGEAIKLAYMNIEEKNKKLLNLRESFITLLKEKIPDIKINGGMENRAPGNVNVVLPNVSSVTALLALDMNLICASAASACMANTNEISHVLKAIGLDEKSAKCSLRFSFGIDNEIEEAEYIVGKLVKIKERFGKIVS